MARIVGLELGSRVALRAAVPDETRSGKSLCRGRLLALTLLMSVALPGNVRPQGDPTAPAEGDVSALETGDAVALPLKLIELPFRLLEDGGSWLMGKAQLERRLRGLEQRGSQFRHYYSWLRDRGVHPSVGRHASRSGVGPELLLGRRPGGGSTVWAHLRGRATAMRHFGLFEAKAGADPFGVARPVTVQAYSKIERRLEDEFFGNASAAGEHEARFELERYSAGGELSVAAGNNVRTTLNAHWFGLKAVSEGGVRLVDIDSIGQPRIAGLGQSQRYLSIGGSALWLAGDPHSFGRRRSWAGLDYRRYASLSAGAADFAKVAVDLGVELPLDSWRRSVVVALYYESVRQDGRGANPFYRFIDDTGSQMLQGLRSQPSGDLELLLGKIEYRYRLWRFAREAVGYDPVLVGGVELGHGPEGGRVDFSLGARL